MEAPVCVIGAGRSGTNMLALAFAAEGSAYRNLYENRYVWTYGQRDLRFDLRQADAATPRVAAYIRRHFDRLRRHPDDVLIDKTPSNALRIPFVAEIYPDIRFIHIIRDGRDNILSRQRQWEGLEEGEDAATRPSGQLKGKMRIAKDRLRHFRRLRERGNLPLDRMPAMAWDVAGPFLRQMFTGRPQRYGERIAGLSSILAAQGVDAVGAVQWRDAVMQGVVDGRRLGPERYMEIRFEDFVADPIPHWQSLLEFIGPPFRGRGRDLPAKGDPV